MPGGHVTKIVEVENIGSNSAYVRIKVEKSITLAEKTELKPDTDLVTIDFDSTYWTLGKEGFYYYIEAIEPGEITKPLFSKVNFHKSMNNNYQNSQIEVNVTAYATQAANNGNNSLKANGWPESKGRN